jgi:hypothetical protein
VYDTGEKETGIKLPDDEIEFEVEVVAAVQEKPKTNGKRGRGQAEMDKGENTKTTKKGKKSAEAAKATKVVEEDVKEVSMKDVPEEEENEEQEEEEEEPALIPSSLKVVDLRKELKKRGLDTKGLKKDLVKRLEKALK